MLNENKLLTILILFSAISYGTGIVVVNINYSQWGYFSFDLIKVQYMSAGIWLNFILFVSLVILSISHYIYGYVCDLFKNKEFKSRLFRILASDFFEVFCLLISAYIILTPIALIAEEIGISLNWKQTIPLAGTIILFSIAPKYINKGSVKQYDKSIHIFFLKFLFQLPYDIFYILLALIMLVYGVGQFIYGEIPQFYGGGKPNDVQVLFEASKLSQVGQLGLENLKLGGKSNLLLLTETSTGFVFVSDHGKYSQAIEVKKSYIDAIIYRKQK